MIWIVIGAIGVVLLLLFLLVGLLVMASRNSRDMEAFEAALDAQREGLSRMGNTRDTQKEA